MLKGVNKRIVEVNDPNSSYFERAVFYLRPEVTIVPDLVSHREAERLYSAVTPQNSSTRKRSAKKIIIVITAAAAAVAAFIRIF